MSTVNEKMASITQTQMNLDENCPQSWYYYRKKFPKIIGDTRYMLVGTIIHNSIEQYFRTISESPHTGLISGTFKTILDKNWEPHNEELKELYNRKIKCTENFLKFETERMKVCNRYRPSMQEEKLNANINGVEFFTIVDCFWAEDGFLVDWKTGSKNTLSVQDYIQGMIEKMILEARGYTVKKVVFAMLFTGQYIEMGVQPDNFIMDRANKMIREWTTGNFPKIRGQQCLYCGWDIRCALQEKKISLWEI
jgi:hypothetical protein